MYTKEMDIKSVVSEPFVEAVTETRFSILSDTSMGNTKRSVDVRLKSKVSEDELEKYAQTIKDNGKASYTRTFISYYLPDMNVGSGAWATTHFNPDLDVKVLGLSLKGEQKFDETPKDNSREVVGIWFDERPYVGAKITIYKKESKLFIDTVYKDGSGSTEQLKESNVGQSRRLEKLEKSSFGEYWMLTNGGELEIYDNDGLILRYRRDS